MRNVYVHKDAENMDVPKKRGRPQSLTDSTRKKKRLQANQTHAKSRIFIGEYIEDWNSLRDSLGLKSNPELAGFLLNSHYESQKRLSRQGILSSTPARPHPLPRISELMLSEISSTDSKGNGSTTETAESGVEEMEKSSFLSPATASHQSPISKGEETKRKSSLKTAFSSSFVDPFSLSISITKESEEEKGSVDDDSDDDFDVEEYEVTIGEDETIDIEDVAGGDLVFGSDEVIETEDEPPEYFTGPGITQVLSMEESDVVLASEKVIAYEKQLLLLAKTKIDERCLVKGCPELVEISTKYVASALYIIWSCPRKHIKHRWCSQPLLNNGLHSGDLMIAAAVLCSGNNFSKVELMAKILKLHFPSQSSFTRMQRTYLVPAIEKKWDEHLRSFRAELEDKDVVLLGDGRMDSPGHCAKYCTYSMMENDSKKIIAIETLDKREVGKKSTNMEKAGFQRALEDVRSSNNVTEVVTDAHLQIGALMKRQYPQIKHSHDIWHAAKNLGKKIVKAGQEKSCRELLNWSQDIVNHFWHCSKMANTHEEFLDLWVGVLHHVQNEHEWALSYVGLSPGSCSHGELEENRDKEWIEKGSPAHLALTKIVLDKRFLNNSHYYLNFRSTSNLEIFNNHILMYASKRISYSPPVYRARNILAALDYNLSVDLPTDTRKDGTTRYHRTYSKKTGRWTVVQRKTQKTYSHVSDIMRKILQSRLESVGGMHQAAELAEGDPRRISRTIAPKSPPPTTELVVKKKSRFQ